MRRPYCSSAANQRRRPRPTGTSGSLARRPGSGLTRQRRLKRASCSAIRWGGSTRMSTGEFRQLAREGVSDRFKTMAQIADS